MAEYLRRTYAQVDLDALVENVSAIRRRLGPGCRMMGVVKGDAYGHGDAAVASELGALFVDWFGVSNIEEALSLRRAGVRQPILIFGYTPPEFASTLARYALTQTVYASDYAEGLSRAAVEQGTTVEMHIKVDTGMGRIGFQAAHADAVQRIAAAIRLPGLRMGGIFTHFAVADSLEAADVAFTRTQYARLSGVIEKLEAGGIRVGLRHCCNSAGILCYPEYQLDMVRAGLILYGIPPSTALEGRMPLRPVMALKTVVSLVKEIEAGDGVSYGLRYRAPGRRTIATLAVGYADGYSRLLSQKAEVLIRGRRAPVVGTICMDQMMVDVTGIEGVCRGEEAILFGGDATGSIPVTELAARCGTIPSETVCLIGRRVPRVYLRQGEEIGVADYIRARL